MSQQPMSAAELAAKKAQLEALKQQKEQQLRAQGVDIEALKAQGANPIAKPFVPGAASSAALGQGSGHQGGGHHTTYGYAYDEDEFDGADEDDFYDPNEDYDDEIDNEIDMFERELEACGALLPNVTSSSSAPAAAAASATPLSNSSSAASRPFNVHMSRRALGQTGEFEILRLAKIGDEQDFLNIQAEEGINVTKFCDNKDRNALHYAADSGNADLVRKVIEMGVPFRKDELGMTPLDIATLLKHTDVIAVLNELIPEAQRAGAKATSDEVLVAFCPAPPRIALSRAPEVTPADTKRPRAFWGPKATAELAPLAVSEVQVFAPGEFPLAAAAVAGIYRGSTYPIASALSWALPITETELTALLQTAAIAGSATDGDVNGAAVILPIYGVRQGPAEINSAIVGGWVLKDESRSAAQPKESVAAHVLKAIGDFLTTNAVRCAWFHTNATLLAPPVAVVKWFRRIVNVQALIDSGDSAAAVIFNDFLSNDTVLRTDAMLKGTPNAASLAALEKWVPLASLETEEQKTEAFAGIAAAIAKKSTSTPGLHVTTDVTLLRAMFDRPGLSVLVKYSASSVVSSALVLRDRESLYGGAKAAVVVFAVYDGPAAEFLSEAAAASRILEHHAVYVTNTFGFTEKDMRLSFFEEVPRSHEFIYAIADPRATSSAVASVAADKVHIPAFLI